jgi:hypothetical protein
LDQPKEKLVLTQYTQTQLDDLRAAAAKGVTKLRNSVGEEITYRSLEEMHTQIAVMERALAAKPRARQHFPTFSKGT